MLKLQSLFTRFALSCTKWLLRRSCRRRKHLYQIADLYHRIGRLTLRQKALEQKLSTHLERKHTMTNFPADHFKPRFSLGRLLITSGAQEAFSDQEVLLAISRHQRGDWGIVCMEDRLLNDKALQTGGRLHSAYRYHGVKLWIITEGDRSATTILLPNEY